MYIKAEMVSEPVNLFDIAPIADGAAAVVLTRRDLLPKDFAHPLVRIAGSGNSSDTLALHDRPRYAFFPGSAIATQQALKKAGSRWNRSISLNITMPSASTLP